MEYEIDPWNIIKSKVSAFDRFFLSDGYVKANQKNVGGFNLHYCQA